MKYFLMLTLLACSSAPSVKRLTYKQTISHTECLKPLENVDLSAPQRIQSTLLQTTGMAGSYLLTSVGVMSDTVVASGSLGILYLCADGNSTGCGDFVGGYFGMMKELDLIWTSEKAYKGTSSWRCPYMDHISKAMRKVSSCLHKNGEYVAAFEQLNILETDEVMDTCMSGIEKDKVRDLKLEVLKF